MQPSGKLCMHTVRCPHSFPFGLGWIKRDLYVVVIIKREKRPNLSTKHDVGLCSPLVAQVNEKKKKKGKKFDKLSM